MSFLLSWIWAMKYLASAFLGNVSKHSPSFCSALSNFPLRNRARPSSSLALEALNFWTIIRSSCLNPICPNAAADRNITAAHPKDGILFMLPPRNGRISL